MKERSQCWDWYIVGIPGALSVGAYGPEAAANGAARGLVMVKARRQDLERIAATKREIERARFKLKRLEDRHDRLLAEAAQRGATNGAQ